MKEGWDGSGNSEDIRDGKRHPHVHVSVPSSCCTYGSRNTEVEVSSGREGET